MAVIEGVCRIVGGVDTHKDLHVASIVDEQDQVIGTRSIATTRQGYRQMLAWMRSFGELQRIGIQSTGSYRAQIVAYTCASLAKLALDQEGSGGLDYIKVWAQQSAGAVLERQIATISEAMARVLQNPPLDGQNVSEGPRTRLSQDCARGRGTPREGVR